MKAVALAMLLAACTEAPTTATPADAAMGDVPVACDGKLCATANGGACGVGGGGASALVALAALAMRRRAR
jgi:hypothetical protein